MKVIEKIKKQKIIPVLRLVNLKTQIEICESLLEAGFDVLEITLTSTDPFKLIEKLSKKNPTACIGAGTVLTSDQANNSVVSGAQFIVSPGISKMVSKFCKIHDIRYIPGVSTPTEIMKAWEIGDEFVKLFPIKNLGGPDYIKSLLGPFPNLECMASGGINGSEIQNYLDNGAKAVGLGSVLLPKKLDKPSIIQRVKDLTRSIKLENTGPL